MELSTSQAVDLFLASLRTRSAPTNTIKAYRLDLQQFLKQVPADISEVTPDVIRAFLDSHKQHKPATRRRRSATLRTFYAWLIQQGMVPSSPMERLEPIGQIEQLPQPLDPDDVTKILKAIPASNLRDRAIFTLLYETGMRVGEALSIYYADLDLTQDNEKIRVFDKSQRERTVLLAAAPESIRLLRRHLKRSHITAGSIFRGDPRYGGSPLPLDYSVLRKAWQKYCQAAGVQATIRQLRHSRATQLIQAGVPIATIRKQLGHRNLQSTLLYAEVDQAAIKRDLLEYQRRKGKRV